MNSFVNIKVVPIRLTDNSIAFNVEITTTDNDNIVLAATDMVSANKMATQISNSINKYAIDEASVEVAV